MFPVIEQIFHDYNEIFGSSKIYAILKDRGYAISESTVAKIMHENGMFSIRACAKTLYKQHRLLNRILCFLLFFCPPTLIFVL